jgi:hypothetical protein
LKQGKAIFRKVVEVAAKHRLHICRYEEGKHNWWGNQQAYAEARSEAGDVLTGIIHQDSHQQMIFDVLHAMYKGVPPFTMRASMTMCIAFEESVGCKRVTMQRTSRG